MSIEELAAGILQITTHEVWTLTHWDKVRTAIETYVNAHPDRVYLLINIRGTLEIEPHALQSLIAAPYYNRPDVGLAILVGRRGQLRQARALLDTTPDLRNRTELRMMDSLEDACRILLDKQVMDRLEGLQRYGG